MEPACSSMRDFITKLPWVATMGSGAGLGARVGGIGVGMESEST